VGGAWHIVRFRAGALRRNDTKGATIDDWSLFPARAYLDQHYGHMSTETATMMSSIVAYVRGRACAPPSRLIEVAGGPTVFSLMALTAALGAAPGRIVFTDIAETNLAEVDDWLHERPGAFDYAHLYDWLRTHAQADPERAAAALRAADWELVPRDWHDPPPAAWIGGFDAVSSHFFVESATSDEATARRFVRNYAGLARPGALLLLSFLQHADSWDCDGVAVPSLRVHEDMIVDFLRSEGIALDDPALLTAAGRQAAQITGYAGVVTVAGTRSRVADAGRAAG
jgi:hypothetical protein